MNIFELRESYFCKTVQLLMTSPRNALILVVMINALVGTMAGFEKRNGYNDAVKTCRQ